MQGGPLLGAGRFSGRLEADNRPDGVLFRKIIVFRGIKFFLQRFTM
jgi:hypothetical protein